MAGIMRFIRNWTLPVAIGLGVALYLAFHYVPVLRPVARWYLPHNATVLPLCAFAVLYVTFCKTDFRRMRPVRWHLWLGMGQALLIVAVMAVILCLGARGATLIFMEATLVCVISPVAMASAVVTSKLGGDLEEMTAYTLISNFISALLIPVCFLLLPTDGAAHGGESERFLHLFVAILMKVSAILLLPMAAALLTKLLLPRLQRAITGVRDLSYNMWAVSLVVVTGTTVMNIFDAWNETSCLFLLGVALMALAVCAAQFAIGRLIGLPCGRAVEAGQGLGQKNTTFGIWTATAFLHPLSSVGPGCYILWQNIVNSVEIWHERRKATGARG